MTPTGTAMRNCIKYVKMATFALILLSFGSQVLSADKTEKVQKRPVAAETAKSTGINWMAYDDGLVKAKSENKHVFINFTAKWCGFCEKMNGTTFADRSVIDMLDEKFVPIKVDGDSRDTLDIDGYRITEQNLARSEYRVRGFPTYWFLESDGTKLGAIMGYQPTDVFLRTLVFVAERQYDTTQAKAAAPEEKSGE